MHHPRPGPLPSGGPPPPSASATLDGRAPWQRVALGALLAIGAALRIYHLGYRSLAVDEANVFWMAHGSAGDIVLHNAAGNSAPPLYALAIGGVARLATSEAALRSVSCLAGIAALAALYVLARRFVSAGGALFAVLLATVAPAQVFYSQFLREYSLAFLWAMAVLVGFDALQRRPSWRSWLLYTVAAALGIFIQYGLALLVLATNFVFLIELVRAPRPRRQLAWWALAQLVVLAAAMDVYDTTLRHQLRPGGFGADYLATGYWDGSGPSLVRLLLGNTFELVQFAHPSTLIMQALLLLGLVQLWRSPAGAARDVASETGAQPQPQGTRRDGRRAVGLLIAPLLVTIAAACLRLYPYLGARQSIPITVMLYVCAGAGFDLLRRVDWRGIAATLVVVLATAEGLFGSYRQLWSTEPQHMRPIAALLASRVVPGDRIYVYHDAATTLRYYYPESEPAWIRGVFSPTDAAPHHAQLERELASPGRVWMVFGNCRGAECAVIRREASTWRTVTPVASEVGVTLYVAAER